MTAEQMIGTLESVPIRKVWANEAHDLTPRLAENTDRLSEALGMDLELEGTEVGVGPFRADIVLRDANTGYRVVVENMIHETDHDHLGKIITYAAGLEATYAVLIAEKFRPGASLRAPVVERAQHRVGRLLRHHAQDLADR